MNHIKRFSPSILALALLGPLNASANDEQRAAEDTVMASFQRMLDHEPSHFAPRVPASSGEDPLHAAVNMVLWRSAPSSQDTVMASFQRMLDHESSHFAPRIPAGSGEDPLQAAVNMVLWRSGPSSPDTVMASFQRMLEHEPSHFAPRVPAGSGEDPLRAAVNMVLWRSAPSSHDRCHPAIAHARPAESTQTYREKDETCPI